MTRYNYNHYTCVFIHIWGTFYVHYTLYFVFDAYKRLSNNLCIHLTCAYRTNYVHDVLESYRREATESNKESQQSDRMFDNRI